MKASQKLGLMAAIIGITSAIFGKGGQKEQRITLEKEDRKSAGNYMLGGFRHFNGQAIFIPNVSRKFKGYMRDNRNWGRKGR